MPIPSEHKRRIVVGGVLASAVVGVMPGAVVADEQRAATPMRPVPATLCPHGCETVAHRRVGRVRVRVIEARRSDVPVEGTTLWLVVATGAGSYARALGSSGVVCGGEMHVSRSVRFQSLVAVDFEGNATREILVDWRETAGTGGGGRTLACSLEHGIPTCADAGPVAPAPSSRRRFPGGGRIRYGGARDDVVITFADGGS